MFFPAKTQKNDHRPDIAYYAVKQLIYLGSQCHMTGEIFISLPAFYQSTMILDQQSIRLKEYTKFVTHHFQKSGKYINKNFSRHMTL